MTPSETLDLQRPRDGVVLIRLNRPQRLNATNESMRDALAETLAELAGDT